MACKTLSFQGTRDALKQSLNQEAAQLPIIINQIGIFKYLRRHRPRGKTGQHRNHREQQRDSPWRRIAAAWRAVGSRASACGCCPGSCCRRTPPLGRHCAPSAPAPHAIPPTPPCQSAPPNAQSLQQRECTRVKFDGLKRASATPQILILCLLDSKASIFCVYWIFFGIWSRLPIGHTRNGTTRSASPFTSHHGNSSIQYC